MKSLESIVEEAWPGWRLEAMIGAGGYGEVYRAVRKDMAGTSSTAIKIMKIYRQSSAPGIGDQAEADAQNQRLLERVSREIRLMQALKGQTNLVSIDDYHITEDTENGIWYILIRMELLTPLLVDLEIHGAAEERIIRLGTDLCRGLEVCQNEHIVHRDIKPDNVFVNGIGDFKMGDFSVARTLDMTREAFTTRENAGYERFAAPEVKNNPSRNVNFEEACKADIYSLGMVLYWAANGRRQPFLPAKQIYTNQDRETAEIRRLRGEPLPRLEGISPALQNVILKACAFHPEERYASAKEFREALEDISRIENELRRTVKQPFARKKRKRTLITAGLAALLILAVILLSLLNRNRNLGMDPGLDSADKALAQEAYSPSPESGERPLSGEKLPDEQVPDALSFLRVGYPAVYSIGLPFTFEGAVASNVDLREIVINLYTAEQIYSQKIELPPGTRRYEMKDAGDQVFYPLDEGVFWFEILASDASGNKIGFSHRCSANYYAADHTIYWTERMYAVPELRGSFVYNGHTYEVYFSNGGGWDACNVYAQGKGGHLVTFSGEEEFGIVTSFCLGMGIQYLNIGMQYTDDQWAWVDGSEFSFQAWKPEESEKRFSVYNPVGAIVYTSAQQWYYGQATQYETRYFIVEYEDYVH